MKSAVLFVGHGSRDPEGTAEFLRLVELFHARDPDRIVECGFLEFARPVIADAVSRCVEQGADGGGAARDAHGGRPCQERHPQRNSRGTAALSRRELSLRPAPAPAPEHPSNCAGCASRRPSAPAAPAERQDTLLLVVGRGSSDPDANGDIAKLARVLWEGMGFGWGAACFIGVTTPLLPEALERCQRMGFRRIVVFPFFLFTGVLEKRIRRQTEEFGRQHPGTEFLCAGYLNVHPLLADAFAERAEEAIHGSPHMNCEMCKYRVQIPGFEGAVGQPQVGHHHHVRGIGQEDGHPHHHHHDHGQHHH